MDSETRRLYFSFFNEIGIIAQLSRALMEARLPKGLILPHFSVLNHLVRLGDEPTPQRLARAFQVPNTTMTHTLSGLEARGYITMRKNPKDGRSKCVSITEKGRRFREKAIASLDPDIAVLAEQLAAKDIAELAERLGEIRRVLDAYRDKKA
ncbi:MAG: MarR family transcriptional regulator [Rhodovibrionaceae bacterium]